MDRSEQRRIIEALILASPEPVSAARLAEIIPYCKPGHAKDFVNELNTEYQEQDRSFEIWEVAGGYQIRTRAEFSGYLQQLQKQRPLRLSRAALDTLSIIAYKQPATRAEIEEIRGVDAGAVVKSLLDRRLIRIAGQREVPGRPMLYGTTRRFLEVFGIDSLKDLPSLRELKDMAEQKGLELPGDVEESAEGQGEGEGQGEDAAAPLPFGADAATEEGAETAGEAPDSEVADDPEGAGGPEIADGVSLEIPSVGAAPSEADEPEEVPEVDDWEPPEIVEPDPER